MAIWFLRGIHKGVVTTRYPARAEPSAELLPTPPVFDWTRLTEALVDKLVAICPAGAVRRQGAELVYDVGACTSCGRCMAAAEGAARPSGMFELAATERGQLVKHIGIEGGGQ